MSLKKNILLMGFATAVRLVAGLLTFSVVARLLGPASFGVLMLWFSVSALLSLITNFGLTTYVLREIGADPASAEVIINEGLTGKLLLSALVFTAALLAAWGFGIECKQVFIFLLAASVADTFIEFLNAGLRARNRFDIETRLATLTSLTHGAIVITAVWAHPTVEVAATAYALSRLVALALTVPTVSRHFAAPKLAGLGNSLTRLRKAVVYAIDFGFQSLFGQVDSVVLNFFLGPVAVGLYQAGMRVYQGGSAAVQVLANVFLPRVASKANQADAFGQESGRIQLAFLSFGALFGLAMAFFSDLIVQILFGPTYLDLAKLFPLFGLLFFVRFAAAAWGVVLTAAGEQRYRTYATVTHWVLIAGAALILIPVMGVAGWLASVILGNVLLGTLYAFRAAARVASPWMTMGVTALCGAAFVPFMRAYP